MTTTAKAWTMKTSPAGKSRPRREIVDAMRGLRKVGAVSGADLEKTTLRMLGRDALPKVGAMSPAEIVAVRARAGSNNSPAKPGALRM